MYGLIWRMLPGPLWLRIILAIILVVAVLAVLAYWVFPWVDDMLPSQEVTVGE